jgi:LacI family transcriptional regulator
MGRDPGRDRSTIRDVAAAAGVSIATVSRVLNDRPDVAPATREAVLRAVHELGFTSNRNARSLSRGRTSLIGVKVPLIEAEYFARIVAAVAEALVEHDLEVVLAPTMHLRAQATTSLARLKNGSTDGAVLILPEESRDELAALVSSGYPFVVIDPIEPLHDGVPAISAANASGGRAATEHLLSLGHVRIGLITGIPDWQSSVDRLNGFESASAAAGVRPDPALVVESDWTVGGGEAAAGALLDRQAPPTAIFAFNDNMAVGVLRAARSRRLRVPDDLSVVGFDDSFQSADVTPALTTVRQPVAEMGRMAVSLLVRLLDNRQVEGMQIELQTRLVVRESTAPPATDDGGRRNESSIDEPPPEHT